MGGQTGRGTAEQERAQPAFLYHAKRKADKENVRVFENVIKAEGKKQKAEMIR